jgi:MFS family permease
MVLGLALLLAASLLLCFSRTIATLLMGRAFQGMSAAIIFSVGNAFVIDSVDSEHIGEALGWVGSFGSLGFMVSPLLGGIIYAKAGYYPVFGMCFALIATDVVFRLSCIDPKDAKSWLETEPPGGERRALLDEIERPRISQEASETFEAIISLEQQAVPSMMKLGHLLSKPRLLAALFGTTVQCSIHTCFDSTLPLFVSSTFYWGATGAGLVFLPLLVPSLLGPLAGAVSDRYGPKWPTTFGSLAGAPLLICLRFVSMNTLEHQALLCVLLAGIGLSEAFVFGPLMAEITWSIQEGNDDFTVIPYALAYGLHTMAFSVEVH